MVISPFLAPSKSERAYAASNRLHTGAMPPIALVNGIDADEARPPLWGQFLTHADGKTYRMGLVEVATLGPVEFGMAQVVQVRDGDAGRTL